MAPLVPLFVRPSRTSTPLPNNVRHSDVSFTFSSFTPYLHRKNTYSKNCGEEDESSHPTHPRGPALKKKSVAKAKIFFLLKVRGQPASWRILHCCLLSFAECHTEQNFDCLFSEGSDRRSSFDRSDWSVAVKVGKRIWLRLCRMPESSAQKFGETNCENPFACEHTSSRGPSALYFSHKTHAKRKNQPFPTSRMGVARGCGPHLQPRRLKKLKNFNISIG